MLISKNVNNDVTKDSPIAEQIFVSKAYFAGKVRQHYTVSKTVSCFSETP